MSPSRFLQPSPVRRRFTLYHPATPRLRLSVLESKDEGRGRVAVGRLLSAVCPPPGPQTPTVWMEVWGFLSSESASGTRRRGGGGAGEGVSGGTQTGVWW